MMTKGIKRLNSDVRRALENAKQLDVPLEDVCTTFATYAIVAGFQAEMNDELLLTLLKDLVTKARKGFSHHD
jgi:hypothetical protein